MLFKEWIYMLELVSFICGFAMMSVEIAGARLLAPVIGSSVITWSALIGTILLFMTLGYYFSGKLADKKVSYRTFSLIILFSAVWILLISIGHNPILYFIADKISYNIYFSSITSSVILFMVPSFLFGMCTPYIVKLAVVDKNINQEKIASTVGRIGALSTLGSILGTFLTGFFLLMFFGLTKIFTILAMVLILVALLLAFKAEENKKILISVCIIFFIFTCFFLIYKKPIKENYVLKNIESPYQHIEIVKGKHIFSGNRTLLVSNNIRLGAQSGIEYSNPPKMIGYLNTFRASQMYKPLQNNILVLGGGIGVFGNFFIKEMRKNYPDEHISVDMVEIDKKMFEVGHKYFGIEKLDDLNEHIKDARVFLNEQITKKNTKKYDSIYVDVYNNRLCIPFHIITNEAFKEMKMLLNKDGIIVINIVSTMDGKNSRVLKSIYKTLSNNFKYVKILKVQNIKPDSFQNILILASDKITLYKNRYYDEFKNVIYDNEIDTSSVVSITDDYSPLLRYSYTGNYK